MGAEQNDLWRENRKDGEVFMASWFDRYDLPGCRSAGKIVEIPVESIAPNPAQPRKTYGREELTELARSIEENGLLQPITVRRTRGADRDFELVAGHRRLMATMALGQTHIRAIVEEMTDEESAVLALVENMQRKDLSCFEEARAIAGLMQQLGLSQQETARRLGKSQPAVANKLRLLRLPDWVQRAVEERGLSERHARALLRLDREEDLKKALDTIAAKQLTVEETEKLVEGLLAEKKPGGVRIVLLRDYRLFVNTLAKAIDTMGLAGIRVDSQKEEDDEYIRYHISIPKAQACRRRGSGQAV